MYYFGGILIVALVFLMFKLACCSDKPKGGMYSD